MALIAPYRVQHNAESTDTAVIYATGAAMAGDVWMNRIAGMNVKERAKAWAEDRLIIRRTYPWRAGTAKEGWCFHATSYDMAKAKAANWTGGNPNVFVVKTDDLQVLQTFADNEILAQIGHVWGVGEEAGRKLSQWMPTWNNRWLTELRTPYQATFAAMRFLLFIAQEWPGYAPDTPGYLKENSHERLIGRKSARKAMEIHGGSVKRATIDACLKAGLKYNNRILPTEQLAALRDLEAEYGWRELTESEMLILWEEGHTALEEHRMARMIPFGYGCTR